MRKIFRNQAAVKRAVLLTTFVALSIWGGSFLLSPNHKRSSTPVTISTSTPTNSVLKSNTQPVRPQVYWLRSNGNTLTLVAKSLPPNPNDASSPQQILITAMQNLLTAAPTKDLSSMIPQGTKLRSLHVRSDGVHVDLSQEFRSGGGSTSIIYRLAQVIYTASSLDSGAKVFVSIEGQSIDEKYPLGGEGLILRQPITRAQFATDFSIGN
jgi:spore germination protein GerM